MRLAHSSIPLIAIALTAAAFGVAQTGATPAQARVELGRLLFFDPILSGSRDLSCAHCHHPDLGMADGRVLAMGRGGGGVGPARQGGVTLRRHTPSLWNVGDSHSLFWDGRAASLEAQAREVLVHPEEMASDPARLLPELAAIDEYRERFAQAFPGSPAGEAVSIENLAQALASFQRSLRADNTRLDRYLGGDLEALSPAARRGWKLFGSPMTRCSECHVPPSFRAAEFKVTGLPDAPGAAFDPGRGAWVDQPMLRGAFKVPGLRNVARSGPYMHDGSLASLEEVIDFYASGRGRERLSEGMAVDDFIRRFEINAEDRADLVAFLTSLTDESRRPEIPARVPSGLRVVAPITPSEDRLPR